MKVFETFRFENDFHSLPKEIQKRALKQLVLFLKNPRHPSLRIKKMQGIPDIWEGRVTQSYRFTFQIDGDTYIMRRVGTHDILEHP